MPTLLRKGVERASAVMGIDEDLVRPPSLEADDAVSGSPSSTARSKKPGGNRAFC